MINEYDNAIDDYIKSNPPKLEKVKTSDPMDEALKEYENQREVNFNLNQKKIEQENPDQYSEYYKVAKANQLPVEMVKRNWDRYKPTAKSLSYGDYSNNPKLLNLLNDPEKAALLKDDVEYFKSLELQGGQLKSNERGFLGEQVLAGQQGVS